MFTHFWDMSSGGYHKEQWNHIIIEAPKHEAKVIFYNRFGHNPTRTSCTCCGPDYVIESGKNLKKLVSFHISEDSNFLNSPQTLVIRKADIKPDERVGEVPTQGYVWVG